MCHPYGTSLSAVADSACTVVGRALSLAHIATKAMWLSLRLIQLLHRGLEDLVEAVLHAAVIS